MLLIVTFFYEHTNKHIDDYTTINSYTSSTPYSSPKSPIVYNTHLVKYDCLEQTYGLIGL